MRGGSDNLPLYQFINGRVRMAISAVVAHGSLLAIKLYKRNTTNDISNDSRFTNAF